MKRGNLGSNLLNKTTHTLCFKTNKIKKKPTKKRTVTSTDEQWENLRALSVLVLGVENVVPKGTLCEPHGCLDYSQGYDRCDKQCDRCKDLQYNALQRLVYEF